MKHHKVVTSEVSIFPETAETISRTHCTYPHRGEWLGWVGLDKCRNGRPAKGRHQSQYYPGST